LQHFAVSRKHAVIQVTSDGTFIEDLGSRNGVLVNGEQLVAGSSGRRHLMSFDRIAIAVFEFVYHDESTHDAPGVSGVEFDTDGAGVEFDSDLAVAPSSDNPLLKLKLQTTMETAIKAAGVSSIDDLIGSFLDNLLKIFPEVNRACIALQGKAEQELDNASPQTNVHTFQAATVSAPDLFKRIRAALDHNHLYLPDLNSIAEQLGDKTGNAFETLSLGFHRLIVFDAARGIELMDNQGRFNLQRFQQYMLGEMANAFDLKLDPRKFHPEQITQLLKDEERSLFCFSNMQHISKEDLQSIIHFTQGRHRVLFCGTNTYLAMKSFSLGARPAAIPGPATDNVARKWIKCRRGNDEFIHISDSVMRYVTETKEALLSTEFICAPLIDGNGNLLGILYVDEFDQSTRSQKRELQRFCAAARQVASAIEMV
jgi:hypothetical protein